MGCNPTRDPNGNHSTILHTMESGSIIRPPPRTNHCRDLPEKHTTKQFYCSMFCETGTNDPLRFPCREPGCPYSSLVLSHELMPCLRKPHHHSGVFSSLGLCLSINQLLLVMSAVVLPPAFPRPMVSESSPPWPSICPFPGRVIDVDSAIAADPRLQCAHKRLV